jgi:hypothetical protein
LKTFRYFLLLLIYILPNLGKVYAAGCQGQDKAGLSIWYKDDPDLAGDFKIISIPIKRAGNLLIVEAKIGALKGSFVLDTGAPDMVLNAAYFHHLPDLDDQDAHGVTGSTGKITTSVRDFSLGADLHYDYLHATILDLSGIEKSKHIKLLGLLGTRIFSKLAITIDIFNQLLYIHKLDKKGVIPAEEWPFGKPDIRAGLVYVNDAIFLYGSINNKNIWFAFDTGAETNMINASAPKKIIKSMTVIGLRNLNGIGGLRNKLLYAHFDKLNIGGVNFDTNHLVISSLTNLTDGYGQSFDAILGYDFFSRGVFTLNFVKKEFKMYLYIKI